MDEGRTTSGMPPIQKITIAQVTFGGRRTGLATLAWCIYTFRQLLMTKLRRLLFCAMVLVLFFAASCKRSSEKAFKASKLGAGLFSGQSLQTAERKLDMMAGNFDIIEDRTPLPSDPRPPFRL